MTTTNAVPPVWLSPLIDCAACGRKIRPVVRWQLFGHRFWTVPTHSPFAVEPGHRVPACSGSGQLIGPVL